jgi:class 3 adenylate cyclase
VCERSRDLQPSFHWALGSTHQSRRDTNVWGDTVNTASRLESSGVAGRVNISGATYDRVKHFFECEFRGKIAAKNKGEFDMYFVNGLRGELSLNADGRTPNERFFELYARLETGHEPDTHHIAAVR